MVGLRDLRARNIFGVKAPMIEFDLGDRAGIVRTAACSEPSPRNPNFLTTVRLEAELPLDPTFEPSLNVRVRDRRFGVKKMTLGTTTISLSPFLPWVDYVEEASDFGTDAHGRPLMVEKVPGAEYGGEEAVGAADGAANQGSSEVSQDEPDLPPEILANPDAVDVEAGTEVPPPFEVRGSTGEIGRKRGGVVSVMAVSVVYLALVLSVPDLFVSVRLLICLSLYEY